MFTSYIYRISQVRRVAATVACQDSTCFQGGEKVEYAAKINSKKKSKTFIPCNINSHKHDSTCFQGGEKVEGINYGTIPLKEITQI